MAKIGHADFKSGLARRLVAVRRSAATPPIVAARAARGCTAQRDDGPHPPMISALNLFALCHARVKLPAPPRGSRPIRPHQTAPPSGQVPAPSAPGR
jgi:hypothetical protein